MDPAELFLNLLFILQMFWVALEILVKNLEIIKPNRPCQSMAKIHENEEQYYGNICQGWYDCSVVQWVGTD